MGRRDEILGLLRDVGLALDDDDIGGRLGINRHYVNQVCRELARAGLIARSEGASGKLVNRWVGGSTEVLSAPVAVPAVGSRPRGRRAERVRSNVDALIADFARFVLRFERSNAFPGPSLYFHERANPASTQVPLWSRPRLTSRRRFTAATRSERPSWLRRTPR